MNRLVQQARKRATNGLRRAAERFLERRYGVQTREYLYLEDLGLDSDQRVWHHPSDWMALRRGLERLDVTSDDVFVDYGSGLGRAVIVAATFPFRQVIGVEMSAEMNRRAQSHVERTTRHHRAGEVKLVTSDALAWEVPPDLTVAYLYCPFTEDVFDAVIKKLAESVDRHPRPLRLVYNYPVEHGRLLRTGRVRVLDVISSCWPPGSVAGPEVIVSYLLLPRDERLSAEYCARFPQRVEGAEQWLGEYEPGYVLQKPERLGGVTLERPTASRVTSGR
jgi:SAM-dependent methyltransferase